MLTILLARPGEVVTREELQKQLWSDTFVDAERNLNTAINKIREVLGDSAENPRFVETMPRRGYRFIGTVQHLPYAEPPPPPGEQGLPPKIENGEVKLALLRRQLGLGVGLAVLVVALAVTYVFRPPLQSPQVLSSIQITNDGRPKYEMATDGTRLYFRSSVEGRANIFQVSTSGGPTAHIDMPVAAPLLLDISPDRSQLLVKSMDRFLPDLELYTVPVLGGSAHRLDRLFARDATWSPDGRQLVYSQGNSLYLASADGTASRKLASLDGVAAVPRWSPDGKEIRFTVREDPNLETRLVAESSIWVISPDGKGLHQFSQTRGRATRESQHRRQPFRLISL